MTELPSLMFFLFIQWLLNLGISSGFKRLPRKIYMYMHFSRKAVYSCHGISKEIQDSKMVKNTLTVLFGIEKVFNICKLN